MITNPLQLPDPQNIEEYYEPFVIGETDNIRFMNSREH